MDYTNWTLEQCEKWNDNKQWWEPCIYHPDSEFNESNGEYTLDWLCDHLGDASEAMIRMWQEIRELRARLENEQI